MKSLEEIRQAASAELVGRVAVLGRPRALTEAEQAGLAASTAALKTEPGQKTETEAVTAPLPGPAMPLIPVLPGEVGGVACLTVDARALHESLGVGRVFAAWVQQRIEKYGFAIGVDFEVTDSKTGIRSNVTQKDYTLTLACAKELAMVENNDRGQQVRRYFVACEQQLHAQRETPPKLTPMTLRVGRKTATVQVPQADVAAYIANFFKE